MKTSRKLLGVTSTFDHQLYYLISNLITMRQLINFSLISMSSLFFIGCGTATEKTNPAMEKEKSGSETPWQRYEFGPMGLSAEVPFRIAPSNVNFDINSPTAKGRIKAIAPYEFKGDKSFYFMANSVHYEDGFPLSVDNAIRSSFQEIMATQKLDITNATKTVKEVNGKKATVVLADVGRDGKIAKQINMAVIIEGQQLYQLVAVFDNGSKTGLEKMERIIKSIEIN